MSSGLEPNDQVLLLQAGQGRAMLEKAGIKIAEATSQRPKDKETKEKPSEDPKNVGDKRPGRRAQTCAEARWRTRAPPRSNPLRNMRFRDSALRDLLQPLRLRRPLDARAARSPARPRPSSSARQLVAAVDELLELLRRARQALDQLLGDPLRHGVLDLVALRLADRQQLLGAQVLAPAGRCSRRRSRSASACRRPPCRRSRRSRRRC